MKDFVSSTDGKRIMKFAVVTVALLAAFLALEVATLAKGLDNPGPAMNTITVSGSGDATSTPDIAAFNFSVSADAKAVIDAQTTVTQKTNDILAGLKTLGIEDKDIQTSDYNVYPKYTYQPSICPANSICQPGKQVADGYTVSETISVKVRKTADAGTALALAGEKGATNISSLSLALDDPQAPMNEARLKAIDNAKAKADSLAERLGVRLGRVVSFDDGAAQGPQPIYAAYDKVASQSAGAPPVAVGTNKVSATVNVTYEIR